MSAAKRTINHQEIKRWVERHGGHPATVKRTRGSTDVGLIRIDFPGFSGAGTLQPIEWDEWFAKFDEQGLAFLYQEGKNTNFNKLVRRNADEARSSRAAGSPERRRGASSARSATARRQRTAAARSGKATTARGSTAAARGSTAPRPGSGPRAASNGNGTRRSRGGKGRDFEQWTKAELYARARSAGVPQRSTMSKAELVRALQNR